MVTTTNEWPDDMPTHDVNGTDLRRVAAMHAAGFADELIAEALGTSNYAIRYAVAVLTSDREGAPSPEEIEAACREIQAGWSPEMFVAARHREPRNSSVVVRPGHESRAIKARERWDELHRDRLASGHVPIRELPWSQSDRRFQARVTITLNGKRHSEARAFATREAAEEWGRDWLHKKWDMAQADACVGK